MRNIPRPAVLTALILVLSSNSSLAASKCIDKFPSGVERLLRQQKVSMRENLPALLSNFKPVYEDPNFDVRVFSKHYLRSPFSPVKLKEAAIQNVHQIMNSFQRMGSVFHSFFQVLVEAHPNAVKRILQGNSIEATPWIGEFTALIGVTGLLPGHDLFQGRTNKGDFRERPTVLVLTAVSPTYHSLQNKFLLAHEMAHLTQNLKSPLGAMWLEAHADFLAFAATGIADLIFPEGLHREIMKSDGSTEMRTLTTLRSLSDPSVRTAQDVLPSLREYHRNSQVISSTLFEMS